MKSNSSKNHKAGYICESRFGKTQFCGKFHLRNSWVFHHTKCIKCERMGYIKLACKATVGFDNSVDKPCGSDFIKLGVSNDYLSLSTILVFRID